MAALNVAERGGLRHTVDLGAELGAPTVPSVGQHDRQNHMVMDRTEVAHDVSVAAECEDGSIERGFSGVRCFIYS